MGKSLIITEKPSVAQDIAKALGGFKKGKEYYESKDHLLSWAVGHLFELVVPESMKICSSSPTSSAASRPTIRFSS